MKNFTQYIWISFALLAFFMGLSSCKDEWDKHYKEEAGQAVGMTITDYIKSKDELSKFSQMLAISGYDTILSASQAYTVWVPTNTALQSIDLTNKDLVKEIVKNHISRFSYSTSGVTMDSIHLLNGKIIQFFRDGNGIHFGNGTVVEANTLTTNGIVHKIDAYVPYKENIFEYILRTPGLDSLRAYVSKIKKVFDKDRSIAISVNADGNTVYDSAFIVSNVILDKIGQLDAEDSIYSVILPDNTAWNEAYKRIKQYFEPNLDNQIIDAALATRLQRDSTCFTIVKDMVFRTRLKSTSTLDTIRSTTGTLFHQANKIFDNTISKEASNGMVYVTSQMPFKSDAWLKPIKVEAEYSLFRNNLNDNIYFKTSYGSGLDVSNFAYINVEPTTTATVSKVNVDFSFPHALSGKYNIYCVFVPGSIVNPSDLLPYRALFFLLSNWDFSYKKWWNAESLPVTNNVTDPNGMTKMLVAKSYQFPAFDPYLSGIHPYFGLRVQNNVADQEPGFSRTMRIDCIILEPVYE